MYNISNIRPEEFVIGMILTTIIIFSEQIPKKYRILIDSTVGRIISIIIVIMLLYYIGWIYGLLAVTAVLLSISSSPDTNKEAFHEQINTTTSGKRWFSEQIMDETPFKITTDTVSNSESQVVKDITDGDLWYAEKISRENPRMITTNTVKTSTVSDDSQKTIRI